MRGTDEDAKGVMIDWDAPRPLACLCQMYFAVPASQDDILMVATARANPNRSQKAIVAGKSLVGTIAKAPADSLLVIKVW